MARGVNQIDEEAQTVLALLDEGQVALLKLVVQRDGSVGRATCYSFTTGRGQITIISTLLLNATGHEEKG